MKIYCTYFLPFFAGRQCCCCCCCFWFVNSLIHIRECGADTQQKKKEKKKKQKHRNTHTHTQRANIFHDNFLQEPRIIYLHEQLCFLLGFTKNFFCSSSSASILLGQYFRKYLSSHYFVNSPVKRDVQCGAALTGIKLYMLAIEIVTRFTQNDGAK